MNLCKTCLYPDTRPDAHFVDGVCSACRSFEARSGIDWDARSQALNEILVAARGDGTPFDAIVPVSGGKDSIFQVHYLQCRGVRVLGVNAATDMLSDIGRRNLDNIKRMCPVIEVTPDIETRKALIRYGLNEVGDMSWPEHAAIWSIPTRMAVKFGIPLIVWGEQPQREYASPEDVPIPTNLNAEWVAQFGGLLGMRVSDLDDVFGADKMAMYQMPSSQELERAGVKGIWLGDYIDWDGWRNAFIAQQLGFEVLPHPVEGSLANYENLDNHVTVLRDYLRFLKYGYGRATDIACNHIRRGRLDRDMALEMVRRVERFPQTSLGMPIKDVLAYCGMTVEKFKDQCEAWTNWEIFNRAPRHNDGITPRLR